MVERRHRNDPCPCGSGFKFKRCCGLAQSFSGDAFAGFLLPNSIARTPTIWFGSRFTIELGSYVYNNPGTTYPPSATWATLYAAGLTDESVNYERTIALDHSIRTPELRIGFCNRDLRLLLELVLDGREQVFKLWMQDAIQPRPGKPYQFAAIIDSDSKSASLAIDGEIVAQEALPGVPKIAEVHDIKTGSGSTYPLLYARAWRKCLTPKELREASFSQVGPESWDISYTADRAPIRVNIATEGPVAHLNHLRVTRSSLAASQVDYAKNVLKSVGASVEEFGSEKELCEAAGVAVSKLIDDVQALISDEGTTENVLLSYFRENPAGSFLLCPTLTKHWREKQLQDFGQIDFVFAVEGEAFKAIEIESPVAKIFKSNNELSAASLHAIDQVENWMRGVGKSPETMRRHFGDVTAEQFFGEVVIGRSQEINSPSRRERWHSWRGKGINLLTWDDIVRRGRDIENRLQNPLVLSHPWA